MRYQYVVILKKDGERAADLLSAFLCLGSAAVFLYPQLAARQGNYFLLTVGLLILAGLALNTVLRFARRHSGEKFRYRYILLLAAMGWLAMPDHRWVFLLFVALAFLEYQMKRPLEIGFDRDRVVINSLIRQRHDWSVFNNVILRDGLLTLDFKNNRLLQKEIADDEDEDDADEEEFNAWCRDQLAVWKNQPPASK